MTVIVRPMHRAEARAVAVLHAKGIPQGFLSKLAPGVRMAMYRGIASAPNSGVWVAVENNGSVVGFISGTVDVGRCYRAVLLREGAAMAFNALPALVRPATWRQIWETLMYPHREVSDSSAAAAPDPKAELLSIVVDARARGTGTGRLLSQALEDAMRNWGHQGPYRVVTMAADPRSNAFYQRTGFRHVREFIHHGIAMNLYHKDLEP